jgi:transketolase
MRKQLVKTIQSILYKDDRSVLLLGDIGVFGFREELINLPSRAYNIGILEQSTISVAAGLSKTNLIPIVHTIAPFIVERALEQIKVDFGYQNLNGNFISIGNSYDYTGLGCTHHCPGDVIVLSSIPNMQIIAPGNAKEFDLLFNEAYDNGSPTYFRLSEYSHGLDLDINFGKANILKKGNKATIICYGNMLKQVYNAVADLDVTLLYYTTITPFDEITLQENYNKNIIVCEPFYEGSTNYHINKSLKGLKYSLHNIGIPREFILNYGKKDQIDILLGLDENSIKEKINKII